MRILSRPMFKYGGPIKEGVMHGMKNGGSMGNNQGPRRAALVGNPIYPQTDGRAHHLAPLAIGAAAMRFLPAAWRGMKAARTFTPWAKDLGKWGRIKDIFKIKKPLRGNPKAVGSTGPLPLKGGEGAGFTTGSFIRSNPFTSFGIASMAPQAGALGYKAAKAAPGALWSGAKRWADAVVPGDQSRWWKEKEAPTGVPLNPNLQKQIAAGAIPDEVKIDKKSPAELAAAAKKARKVRLDKYLDTMGYDKAKKTALGDALIDASAIVQQGTAEAGSLKHADWGKMINQAIQTTSKRLDKPDQIREAVGLMMTKADLEKELYDWKPGTNLKNAQDMADTLGISVEAAMKKIMGDSTTIGDDLQALQILKKGNVLTEKEVEQRTRNFANKNDMTLKEVVTNEQLEGLKKKSGQDTIDSMTIIESFLTGDPKKDDGLYQIGTEVIEVKDGVPKKQW